MNEEKTPAVAEQDTAQKNRELREQLQQRAEEERERLKDALEAMSEGKGRLRLEKPILSSDREITELVYDFTELTGLDYTEAMDAGLNSSRNPGGLGYRQALSLFARAAARQTPGLDMEDIVTRIGATDATEAVELASFFFVSSSRAGRKRIFKK